MYQFHKMNISGNNYYITQKRPFIPKGSFKSETIEKVFNFAYDMTFGQLGEHRAYRSGGQATRKQGEIFADTFQGKLAECAVYNLFYNKSDITAPDFEKYDLGKWDDVDLVINSSTVSIKSTKSFGNLLLLETKDWNEDGIYLPNQKAYDYTILVRMKPFCHDIMKNLKLLYSNQADRGTLINAVSRENWNYDFPGFITVEELQFIIKNGFIIPAKAKLNGTMPMDAENYYVQAGDMHNIDEFIEVL